MGQMKGTDEYDFVFEINIPDEVIQHDMEHNRLSPILHTSIITEERNIQNNTPNQQQNDLENHENSTRNSNDGNNSTDENFNDDDQADDDLHYEVENDFQPNIPENLPQYPIDNKMFDVLNNWEWKHCNTGSSFGPFITEASTIIDLNDPVPELFFNSLFENRMWTIITEAMNSYRRTKSITPQGIYYFK